MNRHLSLAFSFAAVLAAMMLGASNASAVIFDDFSTLGQDLFFTPATATQENTAPGPAVLADDSRPGEYVLRIINSGITGQFNDYAYDLSDPGLYGTITADLEFKAYGQAVPADGFTLLLIPTSVYGASGPGALQGNGGIFVSEEPNVPGGFALGYDLYHTGDGVNDTSIHYGYELYNYRLNPSTEVDLDSGQIHKAHLELNARGSGTNIYYTLTRDIEGAAGPTVTIFNQWVQGLLPYENRVQLSGRTGGATETVDFDDLLVDYSNPYTAPATVSYAGLFENFDSLGTTPSSIQRDGPLPGPVVQTGGPTDNFLRLVNDGVAGQSSRIAFNAAADQAGAGGMKLEFDFRMGGNGDSADGMGVALLRTGNHGLSGVGPGFSEEVNLAGSLGIGVDNHDNGGEGGPQTVSLHFNGTTLASIPAGVNFEDGNWYHVAIDVAQQTGGSNVTVQIGSATPINQFVPGLNVYDYRASFASRTGGLDGDTDLDNIQSSRLLSAESLAETAQTFEGGTGTNFQLRRLANTPGPEIQNGGPTGNFLRLTHDSGSQNGTIAFDQSSALVDASAIQAAFDFRMPDDSSHTGCCGERADGFAFLLLETGTYGTEGPLTAGISWERPALGGALGIGFDIFDGDPNWFDDNTLSIYWNGAEIAAYYLNPSLPGNFLLNNSVFDRAEIEIVALGTDALLTMTITPDSLGAPGTPVTIFSNVLIPGLDLTSMDFRAALGARTGGAFTSLDLDNIQVVPEPSSIVLILLASLAMAFVWRRR